MHIAMRIFHAYITTYSNQNHCQKNSNKSCHYQFCSHFEHKKDNQYIYIDFSIDIYFYERIKFKYEIDLSLNMTSKREKLKNGEISKKELCFIIVELIDKIDDLEREKKEQNIELPDDIRRFFQ